MIFFSSDVDALENARNELSEQLVAMNKTDALVDKLIDKAKEAPEKSIRLDRALAEILETQDTAQDIAHKSNKLYKFKKTPSGEPAKVLDYKNAAASLRDQIATLLADTKAVRAFLPKGMK